MPRTHRQPFGRRRALARSLDTLADSLDVPPDQRPPTPAADAGDPLLLGDPSAEDDDLRESLRRVLRPLLGRP